MRRRGTLIAFALVVVTAVTPALAQTAPANIPGEWCGKWRTKTAFIGDFCVKVEGVGRDGIAWGSYEVETVRPLGHRAVMQGRFRGTVKDDTLSFMMGSKVPVTLLFSGDLATGTMEATSGKTVSLGRMK